MGGVLCWWIGNSLKDEKPRALIDEKTQERILIHKSRAVGVEFQRGEQLCVAYARREVVLCGGAVNSPQLLMLSGIGDRDHLVDHGIDVVYHSPEVGQNLLDHLTTRLGFAVEGGSLFAGEKPKELIGYLTRRRGMLTSSIAEAYGFLRSRPELDLPDLELMFCPAPFYGEGLDEPEGHGVVFGPILVAPESRGQITLRSADPHAKPVIDPRYLTDPGGIDRAAMMEGLRICARIAAAPALKGLLGPVTQPRDCAELDEAALGLNGYGLFPIVLLLLVSLPIWDEPLLSGSRRFGVILAHIGRINVRFSPCPIGLISASRK